MAVEPETGLITAQDLTAGNAPDGPAGVALLGNEDEALEVLADSAYGSGETRQALEDAGHTQTIKPLPTRPAVPGGLERDDFTVDHEAGTVTCPNAVTASIGRDGVARFGVACRDCPLRARCTTSPAGRSARQRP